MLFPDGFSLQEGDFLPDGIGIIRNADKASVLQQSSCTVAANLNNDSFHIVPSSLNGFRYSARCGKSPLIKMITATRYFR